MPTRIPFRALDPRRADAAGLVALALLAGLFAWPLRAAAPWLAAALLTVGWFAAVRFLLLDTALRRFWIVYLVLTTLGVLVSGTSPAGRYAAVTLNTLFLLLRRHRPWRRLQSWQRAAAFALGGAAMVLLWWDWRWADVSPAGRPLDTLIQLGRTAQDSLKPFWILSLLHLLFNIRLHFLRLKPKLAVTGVLTAAVPLLLLTVFMLVALYGTLGVFTAAKGRDLLQEWVRLAPDGPEAFVWEDGRTRGPAPDWLPGLADRLLHPAPPTAARDTLATAVDAARDSDVNIRIGSNSTPAVETWAPVDTMTIFRTEGRLWRLHVDGLAAGRLRIAGSPVDDTMLEHMAELLHAGVGLKAGGDLILDEDDRPTARTADDDLLPTSLSLYAAYADTATGGSIRRPLYYGAAIVPVLVLEPDRLATDTVLLHLKVRLSDLGGEFVAPDNQMKTALLAVLGFLAIQILIAQTAAGLLGLRITNGIIRAVGSLRDETRRLAAGDLDARIALPNRDEFGELACSFNEMAVAVKKGREEAIVRERLEKELETARAIQERLLPHDMPQLAGFEVSGTSLSCLEVGGDYFDFVDLPDGRLGVAVGDVTGKGMPAALLMANLQASLHGQVLHPGDVSGVVTRMNDLLVRSTDSHMFATFFYGVLDRVSGVFDYTNAGHNPPLLVRADGSLERLEAGGLPLGMLPDMTFAQEVTTLAPGEALVLFSDGITEAFGPRADGTLPDEEDALDAMYGDERLETFLQGHRGLGAAALRDAILRDVAAFTAGAPQSDDITLVVVTRQIG